MITNVIPKIDDRQDRFIDLIEIKDLLVRERYYRDTANWAGLRKCYHPNATKTVVNISWYNGDIDGFVSGSEETSARGVQGSHGITPVEIHFNSRRDKAVSESSGELRIGVVIEDGSYTLTSYVRFISRLERDDNRWYMLSFEAIYDNDKLVADFPSNKMPSTGPLPGSRKSYGITSWVLGLSNLTINQDLPGTDRPESVKETMERHFGWLDD
ncbi:hypothetical protein PV08_01057 [Exophiala spinifera]|uniref:SnoaL-like domain-containing protein n=1 Tax=Exophiala spinifera TaxID=91928 RepID=A0A0D2A6U9_9EURO|nr:uncharacterized protein PV08_01057 [Exophiala spinifera]KIW20482.1 hypothetical protein PV08_01057 [Exophiala spinifera]